MSLEEFAENRNVQRRRRTLPQWFDENPKIRDEAVEGWKKGLPPDAIAQWISEIHGYEITSEPVRRWMERVAGPWWADE